MFIAEKTFTIDEHW